MIFLKVILPVVVTAISVFSQQINISGKVTDTSGVTPIAGAVVKLEKHGYTVTTGVDGSFTLTGTVSIGSNTQYLKSNAFSANMRNGMLSLHIPQRSAVTITGYTIQGKTVSKVEKVLDMGNHNIVQPRVGRGVYVYKVQACSRELILKSTYVGRAEGILGSSTPPMDATATVSSVNCYAPINDVIYASKDGLLNYRVIVVNSDTSGIVIKMKPNAGNVTDADGNVYQSVRIGNQVWTVENWRCTKYNDGTSIPHVSDSLAWSALSTPGYCFYNNATDADSIKKWGAMYNWHVVSPTNPKKLAPTGWHVPTDSEWIALENYLIANGYNWDGTTTGNKIGKSMASQTDWDNHTYAGAIGSNLPTNNSSGFSALPGGYRYSTKFYNAFTVKGGSGFWWSATESTKLKYNAYGYTLYNGNQDLNNINLDKRCGYSVRLLRD